MQDQLEVSTIALGELKTCVHFAPHLSFSSTQTLGVDLTNARSELGAS